MKKSVSTMEANIITVAGVVAMLAIAGLSLPVSGAILGGTVIGCYGLSKGGDNK